MMNGNWTWRDDNIINVMEQLVSYDNRRLMAAQQAGLETISVRVVEPTGINHKT